MARGTCRRLGVKELTLVTLKTRPTLPGSPLFDYAGVNLYWCNLESMKRYSKFKEVAAPNFWGSVFVASYFPYERSSCVSWHAVVRLPGQGIGVLAL